MILFIHEIVSWSFGQSINQEIHHVKFGHQGPCDDIL